jgi:arylformamidase
LVVEHVGDVDRADAVKIVDIARNVQSKKVNKILIKGNATVTYDAARVFAEAKLDLIGNESQTVGPEDAPMQVHLTLLGAEVILLEGIRLDNVPEGVYILNAAPLNIRDGDGSPCRAILIDI